MISPKYQLWYKRVLIPFWVIQVILLLWIIISTSLVIHYASEPLGGGYALVLSFSCTLLLFDLIEIILFSAGKLKPLFYLISQVIKTTLWLVLFIIDMVAQATAAALYREGPAIAIGIAILVVILLSCLATLIYASVIYRRARHGRADRTYGSPPSRDTPFERESEVTPAPQLAPVSAPVAVNEIGQEHGHAAVFEVAESSRSSRPYELSNENTPNPVIVDAKTRNAR